MEEANLERKKKIAKAWGDENLRIVKRAVKSIPGVETEEIWPALKCIRDERNLIGHGVWMIASDGRPTVVWHAKFLDSAEGVVAEYFDWTRFDFLSGARSGIAGHI